MTLPNFLIIGAAKAGTTSLWHYLGKHPDVFVSKVKEPNYFITLDRKALEYEQRTKGQSRTFTTTLEQYQHLFDDSDGHRAIGEASPAYMFYETTALAIKSLIPDAKLICILRDPCERAASQYNFLRMHRRENAAKFIEAIEADRNRPAKRKWHYVEQGLYYQQLSRFYDVFSPASIKVVFNEELKTKPQKVLSEICLFLGVNSAIPINTDSKLAVSGTPRSSVLHWLLARPNPLKAYFGALAPQPVRDIARALKNANLTRHHLSLEDRMAIIGFFVDDIKRLEDLLNVNLHDWRHAS